MKINIKIYLILSLLLLFEVSTLNRKIKRKYKHKRFYQYKRGEEEIATNCPNTTFNGLANFIVGSFHGLIGLGQEFNIKVNKCSEFKDKVKDIATFLGISTEGEIEITNIDSIDFEYLKYLEMSEEKKKNLNKQDLKKFEAQLIDNKKQLTNFKCFQEKNELSNLGKFVQSTISNLSILVQQKKKAIGTEVVDFVYCKVLSMLLIVLMKHYYPLQSFFLPNFQHL